MTPNSEFDWVRVRANCTPATIFASLKMGAERDVEIRNSLLPNGATYKYVIQSSGNDMFGVVLNAPRAPRMAFFKLTEDAVLLQSVSGEEIIVKPTINEYGECRLKVGNKEHRCWQLRKLVLEDILFDNPWRR
jgi:hypothetical protein